MANTACIPSMKLDVGEVKMMETEDSCPPSKKMKQGRLPFKPLEHTGQKLQGNTPPGSKKRKLSDNESPSAKQLKTSSAPTNVRPQITDGEPEVSSSSEADVVSDHLQNRKLNTLDKFFKPKAYTQDQEEISSTNECIGIDLTDENSNDKVEQLQNSKLESTEKENKEVDENKTEGVGAKIMDQSADVVNEDKENKSGSEVDDADCSFIANTSVCEDALKTPVRGKLPESVLKTPVVGASASSATTPSQVGTPSQGSASDSNTPVSGKKRKSVLSESTKKERELQRQKIKEKKERQKEEQKLQKEKEREEKKKELQEKKRQKEELKEKERLEKEKLKQEEKEKKEKERLEKLKQKEEEKKQKEKENEAKLEEKRKKEEERKQKEEERKQKEEEKRKEEEEKQRKEEKKKEMFKGFFIKKDPVVSPPKPKELKNGLFMPFELKLNMKLAPERRGNPLSTEARVSFDEEFGKQECDHLYLERIKSSSFTPGHSAKTWPRELDEDDDVELLSHEKETIEKVTHHVKFLYFHENTRPPYYGTWRKRSKLLTGRNPFKQDENLFDYEVDSDDEWEEEEPGESVSSDEEEEEGEKVEEDDADADDWMVPHGYLSDGEGVDEDDEVDAASKQDLQKVRQAAWESELKRQAKPLKMLAIGCAWENDETTTIAAKQLETLLTYKAVCLSEGPIGTSFTGTRSSEVDSSSSKSEKTDERKNSQRKSVPEEAMQDLIRLVHGNPVGIKNLIKEFRMFWKKKTNPASTEDPANSTLDSSKLDISMEVDDKAEKSETPKPEVTETPKSLNESKMEGQEEFAISKRQLEMKIPSIAVREKRSDHKKICWYVKDEILKQYDMTDIKLPNTWEYVCIKQPTWAQDKAPTPKVEDVSAASTTGRAVPNIMQFAQPMSPSQIQALGPVIKETGKTSEIIAVTEKEPEGSSTLTPGKVAAPADQRRIKDMFSPAARKTGGNKSNKNGGSPKLIGILSSPNFQPSPGTKLSIDNIATKLSGSPKPSGEGSDKSGMKLLDDALKQSEVSPETSVGKKTPNALRTKSVLQSMLSSPELMKPKSAGKIEEKSESEVKEQPMDVDIIVLD
ncbi:chromatin assembly factor 1 subunit A-A-like [Mercenaria mercenaria]|uniref:chromatin assembly factor 1 subunit A-A-like n=1 Tax=Mercenaria mercenaria TaxID=6596 RepID=UPI00234F3E59|nr:chromatin assembly factor 1 subunit A-A-like [Mercenaria mercenaria]